jgi:hypothetical protein
MLLKAIGGPFGDFFGNILETFFLKITKNLFLTI